MRGSSYLPLAEWLAHKKAIINPCNEDLYCFKWAVIAASRWEEIDSHPERISKLKRFEADFDWVGVGFLVSLRDIKGFESRNQISIKVLAVEDRQIYICRKARIKIPSLAVYSEYQKSILQLYFSAFQYK